MPNTKPPVTTTRLALSYRERILEALQEVSPRSAFQPLMTLYLTDNTTPDEIRRAKESGIVYAAKYYPAGATTNSESGVTDIRKIYPVLEAMQECGLVLSLHGESASPRIDVFDREAVFVKDILSNLIADFPWLKIVLEHVTTGFAVDFIRQQERGRIAATITAHHLLADRNDMLGDGIHPHLYCKPILKRREDHWALLSAAISGDPRFFLGTDSAPHERGTKENACGCAGCFTAPHALELYATTFGNMSALDKLEAFASHFGADFYGLPRSMETVTLVHENWLVPKGYHFAGGEVVPFFAGETLRWKLLD
jgi:dihydroorotase